MNGSFTEREMMMQKFFKLLLMVLCLSGMCSMLPVEAAENSPVPVTAPTDTELDEMVYGARVVIPEGTKYYASADNYGSGPSGTIGNRYTPMGTDLYIGGFAILNDAGWMSDHKGYNPQDVPVTGAYLRGADWNQVWAEIYLDEEGEPVGWLPARSIAVLNGVLGDGGSNERFQNGIVVDNSAPKEKLTVLPENLEELEVEVVDQVLPDPGNAIEDRVIHNQDNGNDEEEPFISTREVAYAIEDYTENGEKVALLLDSSGSVADYMSEIADYGEYVDKVNQAEVVIVFAEWFEAIAVENYFDTYVGGSTDIYAPLNSLDGADYDRIIIVTDTWHNEYTRLSQQPEFVGKIVVVCPDEEYDSISEGVIKDIEGAFETTVYLCRLDNELDRIRALEMLKK